MVLLNADFKVVVGFTTRPQTNANQVRGWMNPVESGTLSAIEGLISTYPGTATLDSTEYSQDISEHGPDDAGELQWEVYPARTALVNVDDATAFLAHMDEYFNLVRTEIQNLLDSQGVIHRIAVTGWHLHFSDGAVDEVG